MADVKTNRRVSKFESRLVVIARGIVRLAPIEPALPFIFEKSPAPDGIGADCLALLCDSLAKGSVLYLSRIGGWKNERFLGNGKPTSGRLWERWPVEQVRLSFSQQSLDFLMWLTANPAAHARQWTPSAEVLSIADQLLMFLAYDSLRDTEVGPVWRGRPVFQRNPLCRLVWPEDFPNCKHVPEFAAWTRDTGAAVLEAMQQLFADRWLAIEHSKRGIGSWQQLKALADSQDQTLDALDRAIQTTGRLDLVRFVLQAAARYCRQGLNAEDVLAGLHGAGPTRLAVKYDVQKKAAVLPRALIRLGVAAQQARGTGYLDEGYQAAQFFLAEWESAGAAEALHHARQLVRQLEPITLGPRESQHEPSISHSSQ